MKSNVAITIYTQHPRTRLRRQPFIDSVRTVLQGEGIHNANISIILTSREYLLELNKEYLQHNYHTDVITFQIEDQPLEGEIYISIDRAREQANEYGVGIYEEIRRLCIHGTLHLTGYNDGTIEERQQMTKLEDKYLRRG